MGTSFRLQVGLHILDSLKVRNEFFTYLFYDTTTGGAQVKPIFGDYRKREITSRNGNCICISTHSHVTFIHSSQRANNVSNTSEKKDFSVCLSYARTASFSSP